MLLKLTTLRFFLLQYDHITLEDITVDYEFRDRLYTAIGLCFILICVKS